MADLSDPTTLIGTLFAGKFEVRSIEAKGSQAVVYRAYDTILERDVALKIVLARRGVSAETSVERLTREAVALARIAHPCTPTVFEASYDKATRLSFVVMEWVPGQRLSAHVARPFSEAQLLRIAHDVASALAAAHRRGILHRDLRPQNVLVTTDLEGQPKAKVLEFHVAGFDDRYELQRLTAPDEVIGTFGYISPEQASGEPTTTRSDVYAFGVLLHELICGELPFTGSPMQIREAHMRGARPAVKPRPGLELSPLLNALVKRCLETDPARRFADCAAVFEVLDNVERERGATNRRAIHALALDAPARWVVIGRADGTIEVFDQPSGQQLMCFEAHRGPVTALTFRPETEEFLSAGEDGYIHLWSIQERCRAGSWPGLRGQQFTLAFSPFGYIFASGEPDGRIRLWSLLEQRPLGELVGHQGPVTCLHFLPEGRFLASGGADGTLLLWDIGTMELAERASWSLGPVTHLAMHVQERFVAAFADGTLAMGRWRKTDGPVWHRRVHERRVSRLFEQHGGQGVFSVGLDGAVHCIDVFDGQARRTPLHHLDGIRAAVLHSRSERLYASSDSLLLRWTWSPSGVPVLEGFLSEDGRSGWLAPCQVTPPAARS